MSVSKGSVNKVTLIGRLGSDPELEYTPSGAAVANFTLATNQSYKDKDGNAVEKKLTGIKLWYGGNRLN